MSSFSSCTSNGAPASPSSQQPPLHLLRSHTNCACSTESLISLLSIAIKECVFVQRYLNESGRWGIWENLKRSVIAGGAKQSVDANATTISLMKRLIRLTFLKAVLISIYLLIKF